MDNQTPTTTETERPSSQPKPNLHPTIPEEPPQPPRSPLDFNPSQNAKICSPFYMYNHDSPRPSTDLRSTNSNHKIQVSVADLELGDLTPSVTQEKKDAEQKKGRCLTKPKEKGWLKRMPKKQRLWVKLAIAFLVAGVMVGVAVGIAAAVKSPVYGKSGTVQ